MFTVVVLLGMGVVICSLLLIVALVTLTKNKTMSEFLSMYYDRNGIFLTNVDIENQRIQVVVDTGSAHLLVGGKDCDTCLTSDGKIRPKSTPQQTGHLVQYGSQQDIVDWHRGKVALGGKKKHNIEFAVANHRSGSSNYNILGVGRMYPNTRPCFLEDFHGQKGTPVTIELEGPKGRLWLSPDIHAHPPVQVLLPMLPPPFYRVSIASMLVGGRLWIPPALIPVHGMIFDSGSNMLDLPPALFDFVKPHLDNNERIEFRIASTNREQQLAIAYDSSQYRWETGELLIERGTDAKYVVLGSLFMNRMRLRFDPENNLIGISLL